MAIDISRTVLVGLGGTGVRTLLKIKAEFFENFDEGVPKPIQLRAFDTDNPNKPSYSKRVKGNPVTLTKSEFTHLRARNLRNLIDRTPEIKNWIPSLDKVSLKDVVKGAGARRTSGRLALFNNAPQVYESIQSAHDLIKDVDLEESLSEDFNLQKEEPTKIYVICSLAGGTGSGMFLDVGHMARDILGSQGHIVGMFLLPKVFAGAPGCEFVEGNAYSALQELDYWLNRDTPEESVSIDYPGLHSITWGGLNPAYDLPYLIDNQMESEGEKFRDIEDMLEFLARGVFLHLTVQPGQEESFWKNQIEILENRSEDQSYGKRPRYIGFGINTLSLPIKRSVRKTVNESVNSSLIEELYRNQGSESIKEVVENFREGERLTRDDLENAIVKVPDFSDDAVSDDAISHPPEYPDSADTPEDVTRWKENCISNLRNDVAKITSEDNEEYQQAVKDYTESLRERIDGLLHREEGITKVKSFLGKLKDWFQEVSSEYQDLASRRKAEAEAVDYPEERLEKAYGSSVFTRKRRISKVIGEYEDKLRQEQGKLMLEYARYKIAANLLGELQTVLRNYLDKLERLDDRLKKTERILRKEKRDLEREGRSKATVHRLETDFIDPAIEETVQSRIDLDLLVKEAKSDSREGLLDWGNKRPEQLAERLQEIVHPKLGHVEEGDIDQVLDRHIKNGQLGEETQGDPLQKVINRAGVFWGSLNLPAGYESKIEDLYVFGVPKREEGLANGVIEDRIDQGKIDVDPNSRYYAGIWERFRIRVLHVRSAIALNALARLEEYENRYQQWESEDFTHHIHKEWVGGGSLPDLLSE